MSFLTPPSSTPLRSFTLYPTPTTLQGLTCPTPTTLTLSLRSRLTTVPLTSILSKPYKINPKPLPPSHDHLGDISLSFDGAKIVGPAEAAGGISGNSLHSPGRIIEYDSSTLKTLNSYETSQDHIPWLSLNPSDGILYSSEFDNVSSLYKYDTFQSYSPLEPLQLSSTLDSVQGGSFYLNKLYITSNNNLKSVYEVNIDTGEVLKVIDTFKYVNKGSEMEGITICDNKAYILYNDLIRWLLITIISGFLVSLCIGFGFYKKLGRRIVEFEEIEMTGINYYSDDEEDDDDVLVHKVGGNDRRIGKRDLIFLIIISCVVGFGLSYGVCGEYVMRGSLLIFDVE